MNISKYAGYFHDGGLIDIKHTNDTIELYLASAEVDPEDIEDNIPLGKYDRIKGILHLEKIKNIIVNDKVFTDTLKMESHSGDIFRFKIRDNTVNLQINWIEFNPKPSSSGFSTSEIEADKIYWENKPDLVDPYW